MRHDFENRILRAAKISSWRGVCAFGGSKRHDFENRILRPPPPRGGVSASLGGVMISKIEFRGPPLLLVEGCLFLWGVQAA